MRPLISAQSYDNHICLTFSVGWISSCLTVAGAPDGEPKSLPLVFGDSFVFALLQSSFAGPFFCTTSDLVVDLPAFAWLVIVASDSLDVEVEVLALGIMG